ncbi:hypothetical protein JTB14_036613 [Gonioctena quinquepunctata]|nr:hypothetical protein JTB14_036613 [Gonioctena quinquepunctata]
MKEKERYAKYDVVSIEPSDGIYQIPHQQDDIYNISSRVQAQEQWPTHDAHLSIDHITIMDQMNKPPSYNDDLPPSYEEAMRIATLNSLGETSNPTVIVEPPRPTNTN